MLADQLAEAVADFGTTEVPFFPLTGWGGSFFNSREDGAGSANDPISLAKAEHRSLNQQIEFLLDRSVSAEDRQYPEGSQTGKSERNGKR
jgi:hypothetical protein